MKPHEITAAYEAERKEKRAALIKGILDNVGGEILNSSNFGKRATEQMIIIDIEFSRQYSKIEFDESFDTSMVGEMFCKLVAAHITDELEREAL